MTSWIEKAAEEIADMIDVEYYRGDMPSLRDAEKVAAIIQRHAPASTPEPPAPPEEG